MTSYGVCGHSQPLVNFSQVWKHFINHSSGDWCGNVLNLLLIYQLWVAVPGCGWCRWRLLKIVLSWNVRSLYHKWSNRHHLPLTQIHIRTYVHINSTNTRMCRSLFTFYSSHNLVLNLIFTGCVLHKSTIGLRLFSWRTNLRNACSRIQSYYNIIIKTFVNQSPAKN